MHHARQLHTATLLNDGRVLVVGGYDGTVLQSAEVYDPATAFWTDVPDMSITPRYEHLATRLVDGRVLITGGFTTNSCPQCSGGSGEVYDPISNTWTPVNGSTTTHLQGTATLLPNGSVLVAGGFFAGALADFYDPVTNGWLSAPSMTTARNAQSATVLLNGKVLLSGGASQPSAETYDPVNNTWAATLPMTSPG